MFVTGYQDTDKASLMLDEKYLKGVSDTKFNISIHRLSVNWLYAVNVSQLTAPCIFVVFLS